jgi:hypothetical protein
MSDLLEDTFEFRVLVRCHRVSRGSTPHSFTQTNQRVILFRPYAPFMERNLSLNSCGCTAPRSNEIDGYMQQRPVGFLSGQEESASEATLRNTYL